MADLTEAQSSLSVKIAGAAPSTGVEDNFMEVQSDGSVSARTLDGSGTSIGSSFGVSTNGLRVAAQIGNATGAADFGAGATSSQTPRTAANLYDSSANALTSTAIASARGLDQFMQGMKGTVSAANSSTALLTANSVFTGAFEDVSGYAQISLSIFSDQASATDGLVFQWSSDGTNVDRNEASSVLASTGRAFAITIRGQFFRVVYTNGGAGQGVFRMKTNYNLAGSGQINKPIKASVTTDNFAALTQAPIMLRNPDNSFSNVPFGQALMSASAPVVIASDQSPVSTFYGPAPTAPGLAAGQTTANAISDIMKTAYTEQSVNAQRSFVSSSASDGIGGTGLRSVILTYLDATGAGPFTETVVLNGTTPVNTVGTNICFVEKMEGVTVGSFGGAIGTISLKAATAGGGATIATIAVGDVQTFFAHHYVPVGKTMYLMNMQVVADGSYSLFTLILRVPTVANTPPLRLGALGCPSRDTSSRQYIRPKQITGPAHLMCQGTPTANGTIMYAELDYFDQ